MRNIEFKKAVEEKKEAIKGTKYLLLKNRDKLKSNEKKQLQRLLKLNENINIAYMLKDDLKRMWGYKSTDWANRCLDSWVSTAIASGIPPLRKFARTVDNYRYGLVNHCYYPIDTGKLEGMNNKIKVIKRIAYGFHDDDYFILKIKQGRSPLPNTD